jgi:hypothetical protein
MRRRDSWEKRQRRLESLDRKGVSAGVSALVVIGVLIVGGLVWFGVTRGAVSFDSERWKANDGCENRVRGRMVDDLRDNYLHKGMAVRDVRKLLGPPYSTFGPGDIGKAGSPVNADGGLAYYLDPSLVDCHVLYIAFHHGRLSGVLEGEN